MGNQKRTSHGGPYAREREQTEFDTLTLAMSLRAKVARYVMNEKRVPKKWRYFDGKPAVDYARYIRDCISCANDIRIGTGADSDGIKERLRLEEKALSYCNLLQCQLIAITEDCDGATDESMREIADALAELIRKIKNWNKSDMKRSV